MAYECRENVGRANCKTYSWGANSYGQLAQGHTEDQLLPREITPFNIPNLKAISGGGGHSLATTESGQVYVCGSNNRGQLGLGTKEDTKSWTMVQSLKGVSVKKAEGGWDFTLMLTVDGRVFVTGSNAFQQLGLPNVQNSTEPIQVELPENDAVLDIAAGLRHSVVLTEKGNVYTWGAGRRGQLGVVKDNRVLSKSAEPVPVSGLPAEDKVAQVEAGSHHTLGLTEKGHVIVWGCNKYGQTTQDPDTETQINSPYIVPRECFDSNVVNVKCGWTHNIVQTSNGTVYSWGRADYGQLGRPCDLSYDHIPKPITGLAAITRFVCGSEHNLAISDTGQLVTWGWNEHGICGTGDEVNVRSPQTVSLPGGKVSHVASGAGHSFAVCYNG